MTLRTLIVEDCSHLRDMLKLMLLNTRLADFQFTEAGDGVEALKKFSPKRFDILFVDWNMPNMSGIEFVRAVRTAGKPYHVPIVMVTAECTMGRIEDALDGAGADAYIVKPFTGADLRRHLSPVIEGIEERRRIGGQLRGIFGRWAGG
jgi:two-component system chemotaxis response regulator CheY